MAVKKTLSQLALSLLLSGTLSACGVDLGTFEKGNNDYSDYYSSIGDVKGLYDGGDASYDLKKSLFNETTMKEFKWSDASDEVKQQEYLYLIIPFEKDLKIETFAFYVYSPFNCNIEMSVYYFKNDSLTPKKIKYLTSPETEPIYNDDGEVIGEKPIEYDDRSLGETLVSGTLKVFSDQWVSIGFGGFNQYGYDDGCLHVEDGGLLYVRIENNSGWNVNRLQPVTFSFINLLVRAN